MNNDNNSINMDTCLQTLRTTGAVEFELNASQLSCFQHCCTRIDRAASLSSSGGFIGKLFLIIYLPLFMVLNALSTRGDHDLAVLVDLYAVARGELKSVTGEEISVTRIKVSFQGRNGASA